MDNSLQTNWLRQYIAPDEYILWRGKPGEGNLFTPSDVFLIPFSLMWCGFAVFWEMTVISNNTPFFFKLFGIPFVALGLYIVFGRFIHRRWLLRNTEYVITDHCIYIKSGRNVRMLFANSLPPMDVVLNKDGTATVRFTDTSYHRAGRGVPMGSFSRPNGTYALENLSDLRAVQAAISQMGNR